MAHKSRVVLKTKFESGRTPTEEDFSDLLDSGLNKLDDQIVVRHIVEGSEEAKYIGIGSADPESPVSIKNRSGNSNLIGFENQGGEEKWRIEIDPNGAGEGLAITEKGTSSSNFFMESGGKVGIGTKTPEEQLEVQGKTKSEEFIGEVKWENLSNVPVTSFVPKGGVMMWSGDPEDVPEGWILCDGDNNTPDLRDRFIVGAGTAYSVGNTGGSDGVQLQNSEMPAHSHGSGNLSTNSVGDHTHTFGTGRKNNNGGIPMKAGSHDYTAAAGRTDGAGAHSHTLSGSTSNSGGNQPHENRPPYYALCFIMKL